MTKVTVQEKEELMKHCAAIQEILDKYPWKENEKSAYVSMMSRCKSEIEHLTLYVSCLRTEDTIA